jgi:hypothetical protein
VSDWLNQPEPPTAHASLAVRAYTPRKYAVVPCSDLVHEVPSQCMISDPPVSRPTAQTSLAELPDTPYRRLEIAGYGDVYGGGLQTVPEPQLVLR